MLFPSTLKELEAGVQFFSYYRKFVPYVAAIAEPLHQLKTLHFRHVPSGRQQYAASTKMSLELHQDNGSSKEQYDKLLSKAKEAWEIQKRKKRRADVGEADPN